MIDHQKIIQEVNNYYKVDVFEKTRKREICFARQVTINLIWVFSGMKLEEIGSLFGQDHTTVIHSRNHIWHLCRHYPEIRKQVIEIENLIE